MLGTETHWLGVLVAAVLGFAVGGLWYGPVFGKPWAKARGLTDEALKEGFNAPLVFGLGIRAEPVFELHPRPCAGDLRRARPASLMMISGGLALGFILPAMGVNYLFSRMTLKLYAIDAGYWLVIYTLMGAVLFWLR